VSFKAQIYAAREEWIEADKFRFLVRRVGDLPLAQLRSKTTEQFDFLIDLVRASIINWDRVTEADVAPGGGDQAVPFDSDTFMVWLEDQEEVWNAVLTGVLGVMERHRARKAEAKNG
jgi:hypothetical protein